jgi:malonyl-CoA O-methyltransferase
LAPRRARAIPVPAEPRYPAPDPRDVDPRAVRRAFGRAAVTYDAAAALAREVAGRLAQRLDVIRLDPAAILDAGCGTGDAIGELGARYPHARVIAIDFALPMVRAASRRSRRRATLLRRLLAQVRTRARSPSPLFVCGDIDRLPVGGVSLDMVWSNLALPWVNDVPRVFAEFRRTLKVGGLVAFSTFGPDTLKELAAAFARVDGHTHVNRFVDMHDLGDMLVAAGFADPVMEMETLTLTYAEPRAAFDELKALGATNATRGRSRGLTGKHRWRRMIDGLERSRRDGRISLSFEIVYGHAWKGEQKRTAEGHPIVRLQRPPRA